MDGQKGLYNEEPSLFQKSELFYNPQPTILLMVYFGRCIFEINRKWSFRSRHNRTDVQATILYASSARSIRYVRHLFPTGKSWSVMRCLQSLSGSSLQATSGYQLASASYGTVYPCTYDGSKAYTVLVFRAVSSSN